jgi:signal peptidase II
MMPQVASHRYYLFAALAAGGFAADLATKNWAFSLPDLRAGNVRWLWTDHFGLELSRNWGGVFGIAQGHVWFFAVMSVVAAVGIPIWLFRYRAAADLWTTIALGFVTGGVFGNLYDRLGLSAEDWRPPGELKDASRAVRDWVLWQLNDDWRWPNFNIADSLLVVGVAIVCMRILWPPPTESQTTCHPADEQAKRLSGER